MILFLFRLGEEIAKKEWLICDSACASSTSASKKQSVGQFAELGTLLSAVYSVDIDNGSANSAEFLKLTALSGLSE